MMTNAHDSAGRAREGGHVRELLGAYVDDELPPEQAGAVADHLTACAECSAAYASTLATVATLRDSLVHYSAPDTLRVRVRAALREAVLRDASGQGTAAADPAPSDVPSTPAPPRRAGGGRWLAPSAWAAAALLLVTLSSGTTLVLTRAQRSGDLVEREVLASHIRSLMPEHLVDVRSNDQHNVKPWFNGRLDFSPTVTRLDDQGFPLLGGRLDYVGGRPVAVVVYGRRQHVVNVFSWPTGAPDAGVASASANGYHALHWREGGVERWAVSDLNGVELGQLADLLRKAAR